MENNNIEHGVEHTCVTQGPERLACLCQNSKIAVSDDSAVILREVRLLRQPNWIATPNCDLIRSGQVKLIKHMPRPEEGIVPLTGLRAYRELGPYSKPQRVGELADRRFDPKKNVTPGSMVKDWNKHNVITKLPSPGC